MQVNAEAGYANITGSRQYTNGAWMNKRRDSAHGDVEPGDELFIYCTASVPDFGRSLAFSVEVLEVNPDRTTFSLSEPRRFQRPLDRSDILRLIAEEKLPDVFRSCGAQGFNITKLEPHDAQQVLEILEAKTDSGVIPLGAEGSPQMSGSPSDRLIEQHLEQWLVDRWDQIKGEFGAPLELYKEDGVSVGQQYDTGIVGRMDLLCEDTSNGALVVVELKRGKQSDAVIGQLTRYMGWVQEHLANGREVKGIILTADYDQRLRYAVRAIPGIRLLRYETHFRIIPQET